MFFDFRKNEMIMITATEIENDKAVRAHFGLNKKKK
jgi:hypothetical protein